MTIKQQGGIFGRNPTFNDVTVDGGLSMGDSIKAQFGESLQIYHDGTNSRIDDVNGANLILRSSADVRIDKYTGENMGVFNADGSVDLYHNNSKKFETSSTGISVTGNIAVPSGNGIDFSATSGTGTSELFDDYEEGTWTPSVSSGSGVITTVGTVSGFYTKIGRVVNVIFNVAITDNGTGSGFIVLTGIPFVPSASAVYAGSGVNSSTAKSLSVTTVNASSQTYVRLYDGTYPVASGQTLRGNVIYIV